jgi:hypothetical protein
MSIGRNINSLFVPYWLCLKLKEKGFDRTCLASYSDKHTFNTGGHYYRITPSKESVAIAPLYQQVVDWLELTHNIHLDRIWYDDKITPPRWVYHVEKQYAGSDYDNAIELALTLIKE